MLQNTATLEKRYQQFIQTICQNEQVFALKLPQQDQYAFLPSAHEEYEDGEPVGVVCFLVIRRPRPRLLPRGMGGL